MNENSKSLWSIPVFWLVVGLPALSIVVGVGLVVTSILAGGADEVSDPVQQVSQIQTTDLAMDETAKKMGLSMVLRIEDGVIEVLPATGAIGTNAPLQLWLEHPTRQADDLHLELTQQGPGWRVSRTVGSDHDWIVQLRDANNSWRLRGRLPRQQSATRLAPSLGGDR